MKSAKIASRKYFEIVLNEAASSPLYPRFTEITYSTAMRTMQMMIPGITPAMNNSPMETPVETPYRTMVRLGGMMSPIVPDAATTAPAKFLSYPFSTIGASITPPIAAVVAGADPDTAPKKVEARVATRARPPFILPKSAPARFTSLLETPPAAMMFPARIKKGMAMRAKEFPALKVFWMSTSTPKAPVTSTEKMHVRPRATAMGTPMNRKNRKNTMRYTLMTGTPSASSGIRG